MNNSSEVVGTKVPIVYWSSAYFLAVGVLHLWGYWSAFDVNVLEYVSLTDIVKTAAYPIASVFVFVAIGVLLGDVFFSHRSVQPGMGSGTPIGRIFNRYFPFLASAYALGTLAYFLLGSIEKWYVLPFLVGVPVSSALSEAGLLSSVVRGQRARMKLLLLLSVLPFFSYGQGALRAGDIVDGKKYSYVVSPIVGYELDMKTSRELRPRYVGKAGEQYFFWLPASRSLLNVSQSQIQQLEIKRQAR